MIKTAQKILIIGGTTWRDSDDPRLGGTTVLMDNFIDYCIEQDVPHIVIPTNKYNARFARIRNLAEVMKGIILHSKKGDIAMVNISSKSGIITLFPAVVFLSQLLGMQVVCRMFAGSIHKYLDADSFRKRIVLHYLKKTKVSFFETEEILKWFEQNNYKALWFPNVRNGCDLKVSDHYEKRLVFLSQVYEDKGVDILLRISNRLPDDYQIDIYGPIVGSKYTMDYFKQYHAQYKGVLKPDEVVKTLSEYNMMVFPTWWHSEGYPGVIIEALSVGMPVISTRIGGIPEMITNGKSGLLVDVKDEDAFEKAILSVDQQKYNQLCIEAKKRFDAYNADIVNPRIINEMMK